MSLVPLTVLDQRARGASRQERRVVALFADISGFTALTERLAEHGRAGAELLADALGTYFDPLVSAVHARGGEITGFAGDAFTAVFEDDGTDRGPSAAIEAALAMRAFFASHATHTSRGVAFRFALKVGLAADRATFDVVAPRTARAIWLAHGPAIDRSALAEHHAASGEIIVARDLGDRLPALALEAVAKDPAFLRVPEAATHVDRLPRAPSPAGDEGAFFGRAAREFPREGEFRDVTSVFLSFDGVGELPPFTARLADILARYDEALLRVDTGDKGGVAWTFFGAPLASEDQTHSALAFAREALASAPAGARLRAGISRGTVYAGFLGTSERRELTCLGLSVNVAARLMTGAPFGEVWCTEEVRRAVRGARFEPRGERALKGLAHTVPIFALAALAQRSDRTSGAELVGREAELGRLMAIVEKVADGGPSSVTWIDGEAGQGKSLLVETLRARAGSVSWAEAPCDRTHREALAPFAHLVRDWAGLSPDLDEAGAIERLDRAVAPLAETARRRYPALSSDLLRLRSALAAVVGLKRPDPIYDALDARLRFENQIAATCAVLLGLARSESLVLFVDDVMWIDDASVRVLRFLLEEAPDASIAVLLTSRPRDDGSPFRLGLGGSVASETISLGELGEEGIAALARARLGREPSPELAELLLRRSGGNPFFAEQILVLLEERGALVSSGDVVGAGAGDLDVPADVRSVLVARIDRLGGEVKQTVQAASVLGRDLERRTLTTMLDSTRDDEIEAAQLARVWSALDDGHLFFRHVLLRDAAYEMQTEARLRGLHGLAAAAIERIHASELALHAAEIGLHFDRAELGEAAGKYLDLAARTALAQFKNADALALLDRLERWLPPGGDARFEAERTRAKALSALSRWTEGLAACDRAQASLAAPDAALLIDAATMLVRLGRRDEARVRAREAQSIARARGDTTLEAQSENALATTYLHEGAHELAGAHLARALSLFESVHDRRGIALTLGNMGFQISLAQGMAASMDVSLRSAALHRENGDHARLALTLNNLGFCHWCLRDPDRAVPLLEESIGIARRIGDRQTEARALGNLGLPLYERGEEDRGLAALDDAQRIWDAIGERSPFFLAMAADIRRRMGRADAVVSLERARVATLRFASPEHTARLRLFEGHALRGAGAVEEARAVYASGRDEAEAAHAKPMVIELERAIDALERGEEIPGLPRAT